MSLFLCQLIIIFVSFIFFSNSEHPIKVCPVVDFPNRTLFTVYYTINKQYPNLDWSYIALHNGTTYKIRQRCPTLLLNNVNFYKDDILVSNLKRKYPASSGIKYIRDCKNSIIYTIYETDTFYYGQDLDPVFVTMIYDNYGRVGKIYEELSKDVFIKDIHDKIVIRAHTFKKAFPSDIVIEIVDNTSPLVRPELIFPLISNYYSTC